MLKYGNPGEPFNGRLKRGKRVHQFEQPFGYPICLCSWQIPEKDIERVSEPVDCKNCLARIRDYAL